MKWSWFPRIEAITPGTAAVRRCRCVSSRFGASFGISLGGLACKKRARDFSYHLFLSNSLGTLVNGIGDERHLYRSNWRAAFPVLSVLHLGGSQRIFFQSHKDCAAPPKEENLTISLQRSKPALFRLN